MLFNTIVCVSQGLSAFLAFQRFRQGADAAFATNYDTENSMPTSYPSYPGGPEIDQNYQEPPFSGSQRGKNIWFSRKILT